jgi:hypothetical protein
VLELTPAAMVLLLIAAKAAGSGEIPYFSQTIVGMSVLGALFVLWRFQRSLIRPLEGRLSGEVKSRRECEWRLSELVRWLREEAGIEVPERIMFDRPPWERE